MRPSNVAWFLLPPRRVITMAANKNYYEFKKTIFIELYFIRFSFF